MTKEVACSNVHITLHDLSGSQNYQKLFTRSSYTKVHAYKDKLSLEYNKYFRKAEFDFPYVFTIKPYTDNKSVHEFHGFFGLGPAKQTEVLGDNSFLSYLQSSNMIT